jgi:division/cell wall cluster transcriptional repressor MraZ
MLITGRGPLKLDQRFRLALPSEARDGVAKVGDRSEFYVGVVPALAHPSIWVMSKDQHERFCKKLDLLGDTEDGRLVKSATVSNFSTHVTDEQGRLSLPAELVEQAGINQYVMLVGLGDRLEVWASEALESLLKTKKEQIRRGLEALFAEELAVNRSNAFGLAPSKPGEGKPSD